MGEAVSQPSAAEEAEGENMSGKKRPALLRAIIEEMNVMDRRPRPPFGKAKRDCIRLLCNEELERAAVLRANMNCDWCEGGACDVVYGDGFYGEINNDELVVGHMSVDGEGWRKINYCPICGKALGGSGVNE